MTFLATHFAAYPDARSEDLGDISAAPCWGALLAFCPFRDEGDEFAAAAQRGGELSVGPAVGVFGAESADDCVAFGTLAGGERVCLECFAVEFPGSGYAGV